MEVDRFLQREGLRAEAFKLLAELYHPPMGKLLDKVRELESVTAVLCPEGAEHLRNMAEELSVTQDLEDALILDYSRLFLGPYRVLAPPYGSVYLDGERRVMGDSTLEVAERYREAGVEVAGDFKDPPDHIAAELEFMYYLIFLEVKAFSEGDVEAAVCYMGKQKAFLRDHLGAWVGRFASKVEEHARPGFYRDLASATRLFVAENLGILSGLPFGVRPSCEQGGEPTSC